MHEPNNQARRPVRRGRPPEGHIFVADLADRAGSALSTAYGWIERGQIPARRWRNRVIVDERAAEDFLAIRPLHGAEMEESEHGLTAILEPLMK